MISSDFNSLLEFLDTFNSEEVCRTYFEQVRFKNGEYCVYCGYSKIYKFENKQRYRCSKCKKDFTIKTKTIFGDSKLELRKWFIAIYLLTTSKKGISSVELAKHVGVTQKTAWFMAQRLREAMEQGNEQLFGTVELDETYVGGKVKNMHLNKKPKNSQGRSIKAKTPVFGMLQRKGKLKAEVINNVKMRTIEQKIVENVQIGTQLYTDTFMSYSKIYTLYPHDEVNHGVKEYVRNGIIHSNSIESFWAIFKRGYVGVYHSMNPKHLQRYVNEYVYRFNNRLSHVNAMFIDMITKATINSNLGYKELAA